MGWVKNKMMEMQDNGNRTSCELVVKPVLRTASLYG